DWDLQIYCHPWTVVEVCTAQEDHADGKRLIRVRYCLRPTGYTRAAGWVGLLAVAVSAVLGVWPLAALSGGCAVLCLGAWWRGSYRAAQAVAIVDTAAANLGLLRLDPNLGRNEKPVAAVSTEEAGDAVTCASD